MGDVTQNACAWMNEGPCAPLDFWGKLVINALLLFFMGMWAVLSYFTYQLLWIQTKAWRFVVPIALTLILVSYFF